MMWRETTLGQVCEEVGGVIQTGPFGSQLHESDYSEVGVPLVMPKDIVDGKVSPATIARVSEEHVERLSRHKLELGDIVYGRRGDIGRQALIREREAGWLCGTGCIRVSLRGRVLDPLFLHYYLRDREVIGWIANQAVGATMPNLNTKILKRTPIRFPPLPTQRRIASILSAYDDLIENNTKRIEILEEMARALYREWFVHFRFPGHEKVKLVDSELGKIPEGWEVKPLGEVASCRLGKMLDRKKNKGELRPYLGNVNVRWGEFELDDLKEMRFESHEHDKYGLKFGDIVMCEGGEPGRCALWKEQVPGMMIQKALHRIRANDGVNFLFLYQSLLDEGQSGRISGLFTGATIKHLPGEQLAKLPVKLPPEQLMQAFANVVDPMERQLLVLQEKNHVLRQTRDLLLPKLISGEIDVDALDLQEELPRSGARRRKVRGEIDGDALDLQETG